MDLVIHRLPQPAPGAAPDALWRGRVAVGNEVDRHTYHHSDFTETPEAVLAEHADTAYSIKIAWVALAPGAEPAAASEDQVLGTAVVFLPTQDNTSLALLLVGVRPGHRGRGIGAALYDAAAAEIGERGRRTWQTWSFHPEVPAGAPDALSARSGAGSIDGSHVTAAWVRRRGFVLEQTERYSILLRVLPDVPHWRADLGTWRRQAAAHAGEDYELVTWAGATPEGLLDQMAGLRARMSVDAPVAGLDLQEQAWDAARVRHLDEQRDAEGRGALTAAARHRPSGTLAAFTELLWPRVSPAGVWQEDTLVSGDHRGRRLGMLVKAANLLALADANPAAERVHTWNAHENDHMLAINEALGFVTQGLEALWQRRVTPEP